MLDRDDFEELLNSHRAVHIIGPIDEELSGRVRPQILALALSDPQPVRILIDSPGGDMDEGLRLYDLIRSLPVPTIGIVYGNCQSMAVVVLQACTERVALSNASFLVHSVSSCPHGANSTRQIKRAIAIRNAAQERLARIICARTGMAPKKFRAMCYDGDRDRVEFYAEAALGFGFIDRISIQLFPAPPES